MIDKISTDDDIIKEFAHMFDEQLLEELSFKMKLTDDILSAFSTSFVNLNKNDIKILYNLMFKIDSVVLQDINILLWENVNFNANSFINGINDKSAGILQPDDRANGDYKCVNDDVPF